MPHWHPRSGSWRHEAALALALEITVPIALLVMWGVVSASGDTFYFPPLTDILQKFQELWLFDRVGSDVLLSLSGCSWLRDRVSSRWRRDPARPEPAAAPGDLADRGVPARDPAAGAAAVRRSSCSASATPARCS